MSNKKKNFDQILVELVLMAILVGFIPSLIVGALEDSFGVCISQVADVCHQLHKYLSNSYGNCGFGDIQHTCWRSLLGSQ